MEKFVNCLFCSTFQLKHFVRNLKRGKSCSQLEVEGSYVIFEIECSVKRFLL